jgi:ABC-type polar amino acid transport system ATPase subunit
MVINKLGPILYAELTNSRFMVFTGAQTSGKSTIAKAVFYFRTVKDDIFSLIIKKTSGLNGKNTEKLTTALTELLRGKFLNVFGSSWEMDNDMRVDYYFADDISINVYLKKSDSFNTPNYVFVELSQGILDLLIHHDRNINGVSNAISEEEKQIIKQDLSNVFADRYETVFIPAGRGMITLLATQLNYIYSTMDDAQKRAIDFCTRSYLENVIKLRPEFENGLAGLENNYSAKARKNKKAILKSKDLILNILKGTYRYNNGDERIEISEKHYVKINFTSSGQQESVWILNLLFYYMLQNNPTFFIIEEPESHLFPEAQKVVTEFISLVYNCKHSMLLTTHSPYVLGCFNNLIYASEAAKHRKDLAEKVIDELLWIHREEIGAWFVRDGNAKVCIDSETGMIQNELIDEISNVVNEDFDRLLGIQMADSERGE